MFTRETRKHIFVMGKVLLTIQEVFLIIVLFCCCVEPQTVSNGSRVVDSLKFVAVVSRNGNRGPLNNFKNSPYPNLANYWPYGTGELTRAGRVKMYDLGVKIRSLYDGFLTSEYTDSDFYVKSTDSDLALMSAETFTAGLYPPVVDYQILKKSLNWMPIPVYTTSADKTQAVSTCPKYLQIYEELKSNFSATYNADIHIITTYVNNITKDNITGLDGVNVVFDSFFSMDNEGYTLPKWTKNIYPTTLNYLMNELFLDLYSEDEEAVKLLIGLFFEDILTYMNQIVSGISPSPGPGPGPGPRPTGQPGPPPSLAKEEFDKNTVTKSVSDQFFGSAPKFIYYSGHDVSLVALQKVLGLPRDSRIGLVSPASAMVFELHQDNSTKNYTVQVLYIDGNAYHMDPVPLLIPSCDDSCDYNYFVNSTANFTTITNFDQECKLTKLA